MDHSAAANVVGSSAIVVPRNIRWEWDIDVSGRRIRFTISGELRGQEFHLSSYLHFTEAEEPRVVDAFIKSAVKRFFDVADNAAQEYSNVRSQDHGVSPQVFH